MLIIGIDYHPSFQQGLVAGSNALIASPSFARPSCLERIMSKAVSASRSLQYAWPNVVKPTIFVPGSMPRRIDAASTPFILGMFRSRITRAGVRSLAFSMAATPSSASQQALKGVALLMNSQMALRTAALSSTTRIHGVRGDGMAEETTRVYCPRQYEFSVIFAVFILRRLPVA